MTRPLRVLLVDDSPIEGVLWRRLISRRYGDSVEVEAVDDPEVALGRLGPDVDLLVVDWELPGISGAEVADAAREHGVDPRRVVFLSAHRPDDLARRLGPRPCLAILDKCSTESRDVLFGLIDEVSRTGSASELSIP